MGVLKMKYNIVVSKQFIEDLNFQDFCKWVDRQDNIVWGFTARTADTDSCFTFEREEDSISFTLTFGR